MKVVATNDGGGVRGIMQAIWYSYLEKELKASINDFVDLFVGTSVGTIASAVLASGKISASGYKDLMIDNVKKCFKKRLRLPIIQPKYDNRYLQNLIRDVVGEMRLGEVMTPLVVTSVNLCTGRNHFFKSYDPKDAELKLWHVVNRSWAAPLFFGPIIDHKTQSVWLDGGTGDMNSPIDMALVEILRNKYKFNCIDNPIEHHYHLLSFGTGHQFRKPVPFDEAKKFNNIFQVLFFAKPTDGGLARTQLEATKTTLLKNFQEAMDFFSFNRVEPILSKKLDKLDATKYVEDYIKIAEEHCKDIDLYPLKERMKEWVRMKELEKLVE